MLTLILALAVSQVYDVGEWEKYSDGVNVNIHIIL